jgi:copper chaperone CopZ
MANNTIEPIQMKVSGMMCSFCTMSIERALKRYPGVKSIMVNLAHSITPGRSRQVQYQAGRSLLQGPA